MIEIKRLTELYGANRMGACSSCGKSSLDDSEMVAITFMRVSTCGRQGTTTFFCEDCRKAMSKILAEYDARKEKHNVPN